MNKEFQVHHCDLFTGAMEGYCLYRIPALVVTPSDTVLAFCEARRYTGHDDDVIDILLRRSFDGGRTWDRRQTVISDGDRTCGNPCPLVDRETGPFCSPSARTTGKSFCPGAKMTAKHGPRLFRSVRPSWIRSGPMWPRARATAFSSPAVDCWYRAGAMRVRAP